MFKTNEVEPLGRFDGEMVVSDDAGYERFDADLRGHGKTLGSLAWELEGAAADAHCDTVRLVELRGDDEPWPELEDTALLLTLDETGFCDEDTGLPFGEAIAEEWPEATRANVEAVSFERGFYTTLWVFISFEGLLAIC